MRASTDSFTVAKRLRREMSLPEVVLWQHLRGGKLSGLRFRRQHPVGPFVVDFYCSGKKLGIEVDGRAHDNPEQAARDEQRTMWLNNQGIRMIRFAASDILDGEKLGDAIEAIAAAITPSTAFGGPPPPPRGGGQR